MRRLLFLTLALLLAVSPVAFASVAVHFSPGVRQHILPLLNQATRSIDVAMYSFTDSDLAWALVRAHERGVKVRLYLDSEQAAGKYSKSRFFEGRGLAVRYYRGEGIMHHKFAVIDAKTVVTGSYNWTASAEERNRENALIIVDPGIATSYQAEFERLWGGGQATAPSVTSPAPTATTKAGQEYWASAKSNKFHLPSCTWAQKISRGNRIVFKSREEALKAGYQLCQVCKP